MAACNPFESESTNEGEQFTNVEYSDDGKSVTIYLDGSAPVRANRSLTRSLAVLGHDFFEVVFVYKTADPNPIIARGSWELGQPAGVNGIYRTQGGVNYDAAITSTPASPSGTAILFAGKKTDKTLLAVGALSAVDGNPASRSISNATKSVSFELNALKAGTNKVVGDSNFYTNAKNIAVNPPTSATTDVIEVGIKYRIFPVYTVTNGQAATRASYTIGVNSNTHPYSDYGNGIILAPNPPAPSPAPADSHAPHYPFQRVTNIEPHYTLPNGESFTSDNLPWWNPNPPASYNTTYGPITLTNNTGTSGVFSNPITFTLNTTLAGAANGKIFSIVFQIPVYALTAGKNSTSDPDPVTWFIRPGYDEYLCDLDDGKGGNGGAVLIGIGDVSNFLTYRLVVTKEPTKNQYNPAEGQGYVFNVDGMEMQLKNSEDTIIKNVTVGMVDFAMDFNGDGYFTGTYYPANLPSITGETGITPGMTLPQIDRYTRVRVHHYDPNYDDDGKPSTGEGGHFYAYFYVNISTLPLNFDDVPSQNRIMVAGALDATNLQNLLTGLPAGQRNGVFLIVASGNFDFPALSFTPDGPITFVITANVPNVTLGRGDSNGAGVGNTFMVYNGYGNGTSVYPVTVYFGTWPFDDPVMVGGDILTDYPFRVNAGGSYAAWTGPGNPAPTLTGNWIQTQSNNAGNGTPPIIMVSPDIPIANSARLPQ